MSKIHFSQSIWSSDFLAQSSQSLRDFLSCRSNGSIFCYNIWSLVLSSQKCFRVIEVKWVSCYSSQPLSTTAGFLIMMVAFGRQLRMGTCCQGSQQIEGWLFGSYPLFTREAEGLQFESITNGQELINHANVIKFL